MKAEFDKPNESKKSDKGSDISFKIREYLKATESSSLQVGKIQSSPKKSNYPKGILIVKPKEITPEKQLKTDTRPIVETPNIADNTKDKVFKADSFTNYLKDQIAIKNNSENTLSGLLNGCQTPVIDAYISQASGYVVKTKTLSDITNKLDGYPFGNKLFVETNSKPQKYPNSLPNSDNINLNSSQFLVQDYNQDISIHSIITNINSDGINKLENNNIAIDYQRNNQLNRIDYADTKYMLLPNGYNGIEFAQNSVLDQYKNFNNIEISNEKPAPGDGKFYQFVDDKNKAYCLYQYFQTEDGNLKIPVGDPNFGNPINFETYANNVNTYVSLIRIMDNDDSGWKSLSTKRSKPHNQDSQLDYFANALRHAIGIGYLVFQGFSPDLIVKAALTHEGSDTSLDSQQDRQNNIWAANAADKMMIKGKNWYDFVAKTYYSSLFAAKNNNGFLR